MGYPTIGPIRISTTVSTHSFIFPNYNMSLNTLAYTINCQVGYKYEIVYRSGLW